MDQGQGTIRGKNDREERDKKNEKEGKRRRKGIWMKWRRKCRKKKSESVSDIRFVFGGLLMCLSLKSPYFDVFVQI